MPTFKERARAALKAAKVNPVLRGAAFLRNATWGTYFPGAKRWHDSASPYSARKSAELIKGINLDLEDKLPSAEGFDTYLSERTNSANQFQFKVGGKAFSEKLAITNQTPGVDAAAKTYVDTAITTALELTKETKNARKRFNTALAELEICLNRPEFEYPPNALADYLLRIKADACKAIKEQHEAEKVNLEAQFKDPDFRQNLATSLGINALAPDEQKEQIDAVEKKMLAELKQTQTAKLSVFEKGLNEQSNNMFSSDRKRVAFLAMIEAKNQKAIADQQAANADNLNIRLDDAGKTNSNRFKGVEVGKLPAIVTATGRTMNNKDGTWSMAFPNRLLSPFYYASLKDSLKEDMLMLALALHEFDTIEMTVQHPDPKYAKELARLAAEACIEAGFDPKNITIKFNDEVYSDQKEPGTIQKKLFTDCPSRYTAAMEQAKKNAKDWEEVINEQETEAPETFEQRMKGVLETYREEERQKAQDEQAAAAGAPAPLPGNQ